MHSISKNYVSWLMHLMWLLHNITKKAIVSVATFSILFTPKSKLVD